MLPLVELPEIVRHYAPWFESVFSSEALLQFQRYLGGLIISENKTVEGINRLFVIDSRNQSGVPPRKWTQDYARSGLWYNTILGGN